MKTLPRSAPRADVPLTVCLDPDDLFEELDETNNCRVAARPVVEVASDFADAAGLWKNWNPRSPIANGQTIDLPPGCREVAVVDAAGRVQRRLSAGGASGGTGGTGGMSSFVWNGSSDRGTPLAAGVYFLRLRAERFGLTRRLVFLRGE